MPLVANARMYSVSPAAVEAWAALFRRVAADSGVPLEVIEHPFPLPVSDVWKRPDLGLAFTCGWPWVRGRLGRGPRYDTVPVAAPVPLDAAGPLYWTDLVVPAASPARSVADLAGARVGWTLLDSQSGFSALRRFLLAAGSPGFAAAIGPLTTPRRVLEAVAAGDVDLAPVDSYAHALLRLHEPALAARSRILARTPPTPIPMLVASAAVDPATRARLCRALLAIHDPALLHPLAVSGFSEPLPETEYAAMEEHAQDAERAGVRDMTPFLRTPA